MKFREKPCGQAKRNPSKKRALQAVRAVHLVFFVPRLSLIRHLIPALNHVKKEQSGQSALRVQKHKIIALDFCPRGNDRPNAYLGSLELHNVRFFGHPNSR